MTNLLLMNTHPYRIFENASTRYASGYEALQCDIKTILDCPRGQMLGKPNFGSYLHEALGEPVDSVLVQKLDYEVKRALQEVYSEVTIQTQISIVETTVYINILFGMSDFSEVLEFQYEYERSTNG